MTELTNVTDDPRAASLLAAQDRARQLFDEVVAREVLRPGVGERAASDAVRDLAAELFGVKRHWHKRIVRGGPNTLLPYRENPPDRELTDDDIAFLDFGPVFDGWEADFGRTYVLGGDPVKLRLRDDLEPIFKAGKAWYADNPEATGEQLYAFMTGQAEARGWSFGGEIAGHQVGEFPHETLDQSRTHNMIMPGSTKPMRRPLDDGRTAHWILEVHLVDRERGFGGFYEELLTL